MRRYLGSLLALALSVSPATALAESDSSSKETTTQVDAKPRLGVMVMTISPELRTFFGSTNKSGVLVARVEPGSPAALAGIAVGDVLQEVGGTAVDEASDVPDALAKAPKDKTVRIKLLRHNKPMTLDVKLDTAVSFLDFLPSEWLRQLFEQANKSKSA